MHYLKSFGILAGILIRVHINRIEMLDLIGGIIGLLTISFLLALSIPLLFASIIKKIMDYAFFITEFKIIYI